MSWNQQRTINNLEYLLNQRTQYMDADNNGTIFEKNITANKFIKTGGGSSLEYLMSDGSTSSGSNIGTGVKNPMIADLNANNYSLTNVGTINNIDIGTFDSDLNILKDKSLHIKFPTTLEGTTFYNNVYADKFIINGGGPSPPGYLQSDGSIVSNSVDDTRITALETKTQLITANSTRTTFTQSVQFTLSGPNTFQILYQVDNTATPRFFVGNTQIHTFIPMSMNNEKLNGIPTPINNDDCANKLYVDNATAAKLDVAGGIIYGPLTIEGTLLMGNNAVSCGSIELGGLNTQLVRGDGTLVNSSIYSQAVMTWTSHGSQPFRRSLTCVLGRK